MNTIMDALVPKQVQTILAPPLLGESEKKEAQVLALAKLVIEVVRGTCRALKQRDYKRLDPNPGDAQCQNRALEIRRLALDTTIHEQIPDLESQVNEAAKKIELFKGSPKARQKMNITAYKLVSDLLNTIEISSDMKFLMHCYLGKTVRDKHHITPTGIVVTHTNIGLLKTLSPKSDLCSSQDRHAIVNESQSLLSQMTSERMRKHASSIQSLDEREKKLLEEMLSIEHSKVYSPHPKYPPKTFLCQFFAIKAVLQVLLEQQAVIAIKSVVPKGEKSLTIFLQSNGQEFTILPATASLDPKAPVVVFDMLLKENDEVGPSLVIEQVEEILAKTSFVDIVLANAAKVEPYQRNSTLDDVAQEQAKGEILAYAQKNHHFLIDHIYTSSLQEETSHAN